MKIIIISIGKKTTKNLQDEIDKYIKRLNFKIEWVLIDSPKISITGQQKKNTESELILSKLTNFKSTFSILLDESGENISSTKISEKIDTIINQSLTPVFIIGGAFGVNHKLKNQVDFIWSLSNLVLPHQLVRLVLIEQIYRAKSIIDNKAYHHL